MSLNSVSSVCPHDCPSTCALEVERIDERTIGRIRGASDNPYTAGVVCAKVARYAERTGRTPAAVRAALEREQGLSRIAAGIRREKSISVSSGCKSTFK